MPAHAESQPLQQLEAALGTMASSEAELAELAAWLGAAPPAIQAGPPAAAPRMLPFGAIGQPLLPAPRQLPRPGPVLSVYCDASTLEAPAATSASMPTQAPAAPATTRLHPLADLTNRQMAGPPACDAKALRQISSKLHVAASKKIQPQVICRVDLVCACRRLYVFLLDSTACPNLPASLPGLPSPTLHNLCRSLRTRLKPWCSSR